MKKIQPFKIMIADDDYDDRELLKFLFNNNESFELVGCHALGSEVVNDIVDNQNIPDILIIDMYMPMLTGLEVADKIKLSKSFPNLVIFIISSSVNPTEQEKYSSNISIKFIKKPVSLSEINDLPGIILEGVHCFNNTRI